MNAPAYNLPGITAKTSNPESTPVVNSVVADTGARTVAQVMAQTQVQQVMDALDRDLVGLKPVKSRIRDISALLV
ncbi:MAG: CbbX protein, partial [Burkholderiales bacterium]